MGTSGVAGGGGEPPRNSTCKTRSVLVNLIKQVVSNSSGFSFTVMEFIFSARDKQVRK